jgi:hypothetical protein
LARIQTNADHQRSLQGFSGWSKHRQDAISQMSKFVLIIVAYPDGKPYEHYGYVGWSHLPDFFNSGKVFFSEEDAKKEAERQLARGSYRFEVRPLNSKVCRAIRKRTDPYVGSNIDGVYL